MKRLLVLFGLIAAAFAQTPYATITGTLQGPNGLPVSNSIISFSPTQQFFVANSGTGNCVGWDLQVNLVDLICGDTVNFSSTTPTAPTNGINVTFKTSKVGGTDNISAALVGDGDPTHFLNGAGAYVTIASQYQKLRCQTGLGDGLNAIPAGTYLQTFCYNDSGVTWTITGIKCFSDNSGTTTLNATNSSSTALLTGAITCTPSFAAGTQSGTTTIANGGYIKFTQVADGTTKQSTWVVSFTQ